MTSTSVRNLGRPFAGARALTALLLTLGAGPAFAQSISVTAPAAANEGASGNTAFVFSVNVSPASNVTVSCSTSAGTASAADNDYDAVSGATRTFTTGSAAAQNVTVNVNGDAKHESNETFNLTCTATGFTTGAAVGTIDNDDPIPSASVSNESATEGNSGTKDFDFTITLSNPSDQTITIPWSTSNGTATLADHDYGCPVGPPTSTACSGIATFTAGVMSQTVTVQVRGDSKSEDDETFTVTLGTPTNATIADGSGLGTIQDDPDALPTLSIASNVTVTEGNSGTTPATFTVSLSAASGRTVTATFASANGSASAPLDFTAVSQTVTFVPGDTSEQVAVQVNGDVLIELTESYTVALSSATNANIHATNGDRTGTITNDDFPVLTIAGPPDAAEGPSGGARVADFVVSLSAAALQDVTFDYTTVNGTAASSDSDYSSTSGTLTVPAGDQTAVIPIVIFGDARKEADETFSVRISNASNGVIVGGNTSATATLLNDDAPPVASINDVTIDPEGAAATTRPATFTVTIAPSSGLVVTLDFETLDLSAISTATPAPQDYNAATGTLTFNPGETSKSITVTVRGDSVTEPNETFAVILSPTTACQAVSGGCVSLNDPQGLGTIVDDDALPVISFDPTTIEVFEGDGPAKTAMTFLVRLSSPSTLDVTVQYATTATGTATVGTDFTAKSGTLTFPAGSQTQTFTVDVTGETANEPDETIHVQLSSATNGTLGTSTKTGTIRNDDGPPVVTVTDVQFNEGAPGQNPSARFDVELSNATDQSVVVNYATADGTATTSDLDYLAATGSLTFPAGVVRRTVTIAATGDAKNEANETFLVNLTLPAFSPATLTGGDAQGQGTIQNDDPLPSITVDSVTVVEGNLTGGSPDIVVAAFPVRLSAASGQAVTVQFETADGSASTADGDYTANAATLTFAPGLTELVANVAVFGDIRSEIDETFAVRLILPTNALLGAAEAAGTVTNDDSLPVLSISGQSVPEASGTLAFTVALSPVSGQAVTVKYATRSGTGTTVNGDYLASNGTLTFAPGQTTRTVSVAVTDDPRNELDETMYVGLSNAVNALIPSPGPSNVLQNTSFEQGTGASFTGWTPFVAGGGLVSAVTLPPDSSDLVQSGVRAARLEGGLSGTASLHQDVVVNAGASFVFTGFMRGDGTRSARVRIQSLATSKYWTGSSWSAVPTDAVSEASAAYVQRTVSLVAEDAAAAGAPTVTLRLSLLSTEAGPAYVDDWLAYSSAFADPSEAQGIIANDDPVPTLTAADVSVNEKGAGAAASEMVFEVSLSEASGLLVSVPYSFADGTATAADGDYTRPVPATLVFSSGTKVQTVRVSILDDARNESNETLALVLGVPGNAAIAKGVGIGTILNDDQVPSIAVGDVFVTETNSGVVATTFSAALSAVSGQQVSIGWTTTNGTAASGDSDFAAATGTLVFNPGETARTVTVSVNGDTKFEADETFSLDLAAGTAVNVAVGDGKGVASILNDDTMPTVSVADVTVTEGNSGSRTARFSVSLSNATYQGVNVGFATADGSATAGGGDYLPLSGTLVLNPGVTTGEVAVTTFGDSLSEANETFVVNLGAVSNAGVGDAQGVGTLVDDDPLPALAIAAASVVEGDRDTSPATFVVSLNTAAGREVTVGYATTTGSAGSGDYTTSTGTVTFAAGVTSRNIVVPVTGDTINETDEGFAVSLSAPANATVATAQAAGTIVDDDGPQYDYNGDGKSDVLWRDDAGAPFIWLMDGTSLLGGGYASTLSGSWTLQYVGDYNGDGKSDILWREKGSANTYLWLMDGTSVIGGGYTAAQADDSWAIQGVGDFNGDGRLDLLWRNVGSGSDNGALFVWLMDGGNLIGATYLLPISTDWQIQSTADFNGDGRADILWRDRRSGDTYIWLMDGASVVGGTGYTASQADRRWEIQVLGDFNGDGRSDILWRNVGGPDTGALFVWLMNGTDLLGGTYLLPISTDWQVQGVGDYNRDGRSDVLWRETDSGQTYIWMMDGPLVIGGTGYTAGQADPGWKIQHRR